MKRKISFKLIVYMIAMLTFIYASCYTTFATGETPQEAIDPVQSDVVPSEASEAPSEITPEPQSSEEPDVPSEEEPVSSEVIYDPSENPSENESTEPIESSEVSSEIDVSYDPIESDEPTQSEDVPVYSEPEYSYPENTSHVIETTNRFFPLYTFTFKLINRNALKIFTFCCSLLFGTSKVSIIISIISNAIHFVQHSVSVLTIPPSQIVPEKSSG